MLTRIMKRYLAVLGSVMFFVACFSLYLMMENVGYSSSMGDPMHVENIEVKIKQIEGDLKRNHETINLIKDMVKQMANGDTKGMEQLQKVLGAVEPQQVERRLPHRSDAALPSQPVVKYNNSGYIKHSVKLGQSMCQFAQNVPPKADVQMSDLFDELPFDNPDGGVWKQGYPITYDESQWNSKPLKVFVVPHSHNDPGWLKTFEKYYSDQVHHILENMVVKLEQYPKMRFIYAEMSFFSMWWGNIEESKKTRVKRLIKSGQLEIVTGGWVMTDEANAHYFAILDQMIEGNQWLLQQLDVKPKSGWAIDPFGHSPTMAYLLGRSGLDNMLVQRVHYAVKKHLSKNKQLEFKWRQNWDHDGSTDMFCHMMPFYSYDVPHTCGPDPKICCQFDFKRLPGGKISCPWKIPASVITDSNVAEKSKQLLDQYRKKSQLYQNNVVLVPLGDDFRYDKTEEWDQQYTNYQKMFDYMNQQGWGVEAQFGTLSDYFDALHIREKTGSSYPVVSGDFYTYSDRDDHYWSGYFTSRPFQKCLDRLMEGHLRGAEILFSQVVAHSKHLGISSFPESTYMKNMMTARRHLGLFQHHDGITGTAKDLVVIDYGQKLLLSLMEMKRVIAECAHFLLTSNKSTYKNTESQHYFDLDESRSSHDALPDKTVIQLSTHSKTVAFYNSLAHAREEVVRVYASEPFVEVTGPEGNVIISQTDPFWVGNEDVSSKVFKVAFVVKVPPMGLAKYQLQKVSDRENPKHSLSTVSLYNSLMQTATKKSVFEILPKASESKRITVDSSDIVAIFSCTKGTLQEFKLKPTDVRVESRIEFVTYGTRMSKDKSGAYLFFPDGEAKAQLYDVPLMRVIQGPVMTEVQSFLPETEHLTRLYNSPGLDSMAVDIMNVVDIRGARNQELAMRVHTSINNKEHEFFTDLNGFQIQQRRTFAKLPIQANYYPMPAVAYVQDSKARFSIFSAQSLGVASLKQETGVKLDDDCLSGQIEIMQDRRLMQDDNRGVGQGVTDNKRTPNHFRFLYELHTDGAKVPPVQPTGYLSLQAHLTSLQLIHPMMVLPQSSVPQENLLTKYEALNIDLPCDLHVVNLRTLQHSEDSPQRYKAQDQMALLLQRLAVDCSFPTHAVSCPAHGQQVILGDIFKDVKVTKATKVSLTLVHEGANLDIAAAVDIPPMEISAYMVTLS